MALPTLQFPLRARHAGTDPIHAVRSLPTGGHNTACLMWLDPEAQHKWLPEDSEVTCTKCLRDTTEK